MTISEALVDLGKRLEDPHESFFTKTHKIHAINLGQKILCNILHAEHLNQLESTISNTGSAFEEDNRGRTYVSYDSIGLTPVNNGIKSIIGTIKGQEYIYKIRSSFDVSTIEDNEYLNPTKAVSKKIGGYAILFSRKIYLFPKPESIRITYLQDPEELTSLNDLNAELSLNPGVDLVSLDLAESLLWVRDRKYDRAKTASEKAYVQIGSINKRKGVENAS